MEVAPGFLERAFASLGPQGGEPNGLYRGPFAILVSNTEQGPTSAPARLRTDPSGEAGETRTAVLIGRANLPERPVPGNGDAATVNVEQAVEGFTRWGPDYLSRLTGAFAFACFNPQERAVTLAGSHVGGLELFYFISPRWLMAASAPSAILAHWDVSDDIDQSSVARYLGFRFSDVRSTFFEPIKKLPPAGWMRVDAARTTSGRYWHFKAQPEVRGWTAEDVCKRYVGLLRQSVFNHVAENAPEEVAVSLSGGVDSTGIAAVAPMGVRFFSWYFDAMPECDERENINVLAGRLQQPVEWLRGDDCHPLNEDFIELFVNVNSPIVNPFAALKRRLYLAARGQGCRSVLVGDGGDALYAARDYWLRDMLVHRQQGAWRSLAATVGKARAGDQFARLSLRRLLPVRHARTLLGRPGNPWLTDVGRALLPAERLSPVLPRDGSRYRFDPGVGTKHIEAEGEEMRLAGRCGIHRGNPYWYWPLLEMVLSFPAYWCHRDGVNKVLARKSMSAMLPDRVVNSGRIGLLGGLFLRGIELNKKRIHDMAFTAPCSDWQRYVDRKWVEPYLFTTDSISFGHTILWRVICYEFWCRHLTGTR